MRGCGGQGAGLGLAGREGRAPPLCPPPAGGSLVMDRGGCHLPPPVQTVRVEDRGLPLLESVTEHNAASHTLSHTHTHPRVPSNFQLCLRAQRKICARTSRRRSRTSRRSSDHSQTRFPASNTSNQEVKSRPPIE